MTRYGLICIAGTYLLGSVCTGYFLVRLKTGLDIRDHGSGGVGARNVGRLLGPPGFVATFFGDALKGFLAVVLASKLNLSGPEVSLVIVAVIGGHIWPIWSGFRGGRGIATAVGAYFALDPVLALILPAITAALLLTRREFTFSGLVAFFLFPLAAFAFERPTYLVGAFACSSVIILFAHRNYLRVVVDRNFLKKVS